jgi:hypothetical protein
MYKDLAQDICTVIRYCVFFFGVARAVGFGLMVGSAIS